MMPLGWRSLLFVPAGTGAADAARLDKAHLRGADALVLDLEDAVGPDDKPAARAALPGRIAMLAGRGQEVLVRINRPWRAVAADLEAAVHPGVRALLAPKAEDPTALAVLSEMIGEWENARGLPAGGIGLVAQLEAPGAFARLDAIAALPRVVALAIGTEDLCLALGTAPGPESLDLPCRMLALAAAAHGRQALGAPISIGAFRDVDAYAAATRRARAMGLSGALCIHPAQVAICNAVHLFSDADRAEAARIVSAWHRHAARGEAVFALDGCMIDRPVMLRAQRVLDAATPGSAQAG